MGIYLFTASIVFLLLVAKQKKIEFLSLYGFFVLFQLLYNLIPWATNALQMPSYSLIVDRQLISCQISLAASANLAFGAVYLFFYRSVPFPRPINVNKAKARRFVLALTPLFVLTLVLVSKYGWNSVAVITSEGGSLGGMYGITAYVKELMVAAYLYYLYRFGLNKWAWVLFFANMLIMVIDGARSTGFPIIILTLMIWNSQVEPRKKKRVYASLALGILTIVGTRSLILSNDSLWMNLATPVTVEGDMGSYSTLQSIYAIQHHGGAELPYTFGGSYVLDPILWLLPQGGKSGATHSFYDNWIQSISAFFPDGFAPMGGAYFISEAVAAFSYIGPFVVAAGYALLLILMERNKRRWYCAYLAFTASIGLLFVKTIFGNAFKLFAVQMIFLSIFIVGRRLKIIAARLLKPDLGHPELLGADLQPGDNTPTYGPSCP
jgi:hypothetical protein